MDLYYDFYPSAVSDIVLRLQFFFFFFFFFFFALGVYVTFFVPAISCLVNFSVVSDIVVYLQFLLLLSASDF